MVMFLKPSRTSSKAARSYLQDMQLARRLRGERNFIN